MSGPASSTRDPLASGRTVRVYCVTHSLGFTAPREDRILCERGHELDKGFPQAAFWEYCCDCQTFVQSNFAKGSKAAGECLVCDRQIARRYVCEACHVVSYESDKPARGKSFSIKTGGSPQPGCPGCASNTRQKLRQHKCEVLDTSFATSHSLCPFCQEEIPLPISFPILASDFFRDFKGEKVSAIHNPLEWELVASDAGEFVVIPRGAAASEAIALPKITRFRGPENFTKDIKDYYDCDNAGAGEVVILAPAVVQKTGGGWKISEVGKLEIRRDAAGSFHVPPGQQSRTPIPSPQSHTGALPPSHSRICPICSAVAKGTHKFCKSCGARLATPPEPPISTFAPTAQPYPFRAEPQEDNVPPTTTSATSGTTYGQATALPVDPSSTGLSLSPTGKILAGLAVGVVAIFILIAVISKNGAIALTTENKLDSAIARGTMFSTSGDGAYDYYNKLKQQGASAATLATYNQKLLPMLTARPQQLMSDLVSNLESAGGGLAEWQDAQRSMEWASELNPSDKSLASKTAYSKGRVAYLQERLEDANTAWTQANRLDSSWALPVNGIGLIYNIKKDYPTARTYLKEAIRLAPNWAVPYNNMGTSYLYEKNYAQAESYYQQARDRAPQWARPYAWLGDIAVERKDYCRARDMYQESLSHAVDGMNNWNPQRMQKKAEESAAKCDSISQNKQRIYFERGATTATLSGTSAKPVIYIIKVLASQTMTVSLSSTGNNAVLQVLSATMEPVNGNAGTTTWTGALPETGDYNIQVDPRNGEANYTLVVSIPPRT